MLTSSGNEDPRGIKPWGEDSQHGYAPWVINSAGELTNVWPFLQYLSRGGEFATDWTYWPASHDEVWWGQYSEEDRERLSRLFAQQTAHTLAMYQHLRDAMYRTAGLVRVLFHADTVNEARLTPAESVDDVVARLLHERRLAPVTYQQRLRFMPDYWQDWAHAVTLNLSQFSPFTMRSQGEQFDEFTSALATPEAGLPRRWWSEREQKSSDERRAKAEEAHARVQQAQAARDRGRAWALLLAYQLEADYVEVVAMPVGATSVVVELEARVMSSEPGHAPTVSVTERAAGRWTSPSRVYRMQHESGTGPVLTVDRQARLSTRFDDSVTHAAAWREFMDNREGWIMERVVLLEDIDPLSAQNKAAALSISVAVVRPMTAHEKLAAEQNEAELAGVLDDGLGPRESVDSPRTYDEEFSSLEDAMYDLMMRPDRWRLIEAPEFSGDVPAGWQ